MLPLTIIKRQNKLLTRISVLVMKATKIENLVKSGNSPDKGLKIPIPPTEWCSLAYIDKNAKIGN